MGTPRAAIVCCDMKRIYLVTSNEISNPVEHVQRYNARTHRGEEVECLKAVKSYNQYMGGADKSDQFTRLQRCRRHYHWPRRLTVKFFMWAMYNSYVIYGKLVPQVQNERMLTFHQYIKKQCTELLRDYRCDNPVYLGRKIRTKGRLQNVHMDPIHLVERREGASTN